MKKYTYLGVYVGGKFGGLTHGKEYNVEQQGENYIIHDEAGNLTADETELYLNFREVKHPTETIYQGVLVKKTTDIGSFSAIMTYDLDNAPEEIHILDSGYYDFNGHVFKIDRNEKYNSTSIGFKLFEGHPIEKAIEEYITSLPDDEEDEDEYIPSCSSCGDGGCIHCRPSWFL